MKYVKLFEKVASLDSNQAFIDSLTKLYQTKNYPTLIKGMLSSIDGIKAKVLKRNLGADVLAKWVSLSSQCAF